MYRNSSGPGSYFVHYRVNGRQRKKTLGRISELNVTDARFKAAQIKLAAREGRDIIQERRRESEAAITLAQAYQGYLQMLERKDRASRTFEQCDQIWRCSLQKHRHRELRSISKQELRKWHSQWAERGPTAANHARRLFRSIYNHALRTTDGLPSNPAFAVDECKEVKARPKLSWEDLPAWWAAVEKLPNPVRRCYWKFLLFSGLRRNDAATIRWDEI